MSRSLRFLSLISFLLFSVESFSKVDHINLEVKNSGLQKILVEVLKHYQLENQISTFTIPSSQIQGEIKKDLILENPVVKKLVDNYVKIDLTKDLEFDVKWSPIKVEAVIAEDSFNIKAHGKNNFVQVSKKFDFTKLVISGDFIEICGKKDEEGNCIPNKGLYGKIENFSVELKDSTILSALIKTQAQITDGHVHLEFNKLMTNIFSLGTKNDKMDMAKYGLSLSRPVFDFNFENLHMPPPIIRINGKSFIISVDRVRDLLLQEKEFIGKQLVSAAGKFVAKDLVRVLNQKIMANLGKISKHFQLVDYSRYRNMNNEFLRLSKYDPKRAVEFLMNGQDPVMQNDDSDIAIKIKKMFSQTFYTAKSNLSLDQVGTEGGRDLILGFNNELEVNNKKIKINNSVWNGKRKLKPIDFGEVTGHRKYDMALSISEPYINSLVNSRLHLAFLNNLFQKLAPKPGVYIRGVKLHFLEDDRKCTLDNIKTVVILGIRLWELEKESFSNSILDAITDRVSHSVGNFIESDFKLNPHTWLPKLEGKEMLFPLEFDMKFLLQNTEDKTTINMNVDPYFTDSSFKNTFNYPMQDISSVVKNGVYSEIKEALAPLEGQLLNIDITDYVDKIPGVKLDLKDVLLNKNGHIILGLDFEEIDLKKLKGSLND